MNKFPLGQIAATPGALRAIEESGQTPDFFLDLVVVVAPDEFAPNALVLPSE